MFDALRLQRRMLAKKVRLARAYLEVRGCHYE
jgi:hypothetical protein